jgi:probable HAF family extracellular repeat protein
MFNVKSLMSCFFISLTAFSYAITELPTYKMVDLGLFGTDSSGAIAVNESGQVLGTCEEGGFEYTFLWEETHGLKILELQGAHKLNNKGQIAGQYYSDGTHRAYIWDPNFGFFDIGSLGGNWTSIRALNDKGQIVGTSKTCKGEDHLFLWEQGKMTDLALLFKEQVIGDWTYTSVVSLNNHGHVVFNAEQFVKNSKGENIPLPFQSGHLPADSKPRG